MIEQLLHSHIYLFGMVLGILHAFEADHIVAVTTIASRNSSTRNSALLGILWGFGHMMSLLVISLIFLSLHANIKSDVALVLEGLVGVMLLWLGFDAIQKIRRGGIQVHSHVHAHEQHLGSSEDIHVHPHPHDLASYEGVEVHAHEHVLKNEEQKRANGNPPRASFIVGCFHGIAGSSALVLLILSASYSFRDGVLFVFSFGFGSILSMTLVAVCVGFIIQHTEKFKRLSLGIRIGSSVLCIVVGASLLYTSVTSFF